MADTRGDANETWLKRTGQAWKLNLFLAMFLPAGCVLEFASDHFGITALATLVIAASFAFFCLAIRCRHCRTAIGWRQVSTEGATVAQMLTARACPRCGCRELSR